MTTTYLLKRCKSISFANSVKHIPTKFTDDELKNNIIYISDSDSGNRTEVSFLPKPTTIDSFQIPSSKSAIVIITLANKVKTNISVPYSDPDILYTIDCIDYTSLYCDKQDREEQILEYKDTLINLVNNSKFLDEKKLSCDFIDFLQFIFQNINDGNLKLNILRILHNNDVSTLNLEKKYPIEYVTEETTLIEPTKEFADIKIVINKDDTNISSNSSVYKSDKEELKKATLGNSTQLEAFSKNKFTVIHNKKSANIDNRIFKQNHDILDSLARNGVVCSPNTGSILSIQRLVNKLHKFNSFDIIFIHPSYELKITRSEYPSELIEPSYTINEGELLAVIYRYIVLNFFGYCSVFTSGMEELGYLI